MATLDFYQNQIYTLEYNHTSNRLLVVALYVDDIPIVGTPSEISQEKARTFQSIFNNKLRTPILFPKHASYA